MSCEHEPVAILNPHLFRTKHSLCTKLKRRAVTFHGISKPVLAEARMRKAYIGLLRLSTCAALEKVGR